MTSPSSSPSPPLELDQGNHDLDSGYNSGSPSEASLPEIYFTKSHLTFLNRQLQFLEPQGKLEIRPLILGTDPLMNSRNFEMVRYDVAQSLSGDGFRPDRLDDP